MSNVTITADQFEDVMFNPALVVVQKEKSFMSEHFTWLYVYDKQGPEGKVTDVYTRIIDMNGSQYSWSKA